MTKEQSIVLSNLRKAHGKQVAFDLYHALNGSAPSRHELKDLKITTKSQDVYLITDGEYVKVGIAKNVQNRRNELQTSNPKTLRIAATIEYGGIELEHKLHTKYAKYHARGEWFKLSKEIIEDIKFFVMSHYLRTGILNYECATVYHQTKLIA